MEFALYTWAKSLIGIPDIFLHQAISYCELAFEWPPSIAEFISICEKQMGTPNCEEVYQLALRRECAHPIVKRVLHSIGDWNFRNDSEKDLRKKVEVAYKENLIKLRLERNRGQS